MCMNASKGTRRRSDEGERNSMPSRSPSPRIAFIISYPPRASCNLLRSLAPDSMPRGPRFSSCKTDVYKRQVSQNFLLKGWNNLFSKPFLNFPSFLKFLVYQLFSNNLLLQNGCMKIQCLKSLIFSSKLSNRREK